MKDTTHSWSVANFETYRVSLTDFIRTRILPLLDANTCRRILIRAPVKSGKREMVEYLAVRDLAYQSNRVHAFVSSFHRVADEDQRKELKNHNMEVFSLRTKQNASACIKWINDKLKAKKEVVVHIDECDFGSGEKQILAQVYKEVRNNEKITCILYSATPEEVLFSGEVDEEHSEEMIEDFAEGELILYEPPTSFCGPKTFLAENLVKEAKPFFTFKNNTITLSEQGKQIITDLKDTCADGKGRNILVLRLSYADLGKGKANRKENKAIYQFLKYWETAPELEGCVILADKSEGDISASNILKQKIDWSNQMYWKLQAKDIPLIVVIDQTSSRSTEWACHDRVFAYHDFRNTISFNTISQAQERVNHYSTKYPGSFQQIEIYGHVKTFLLSAGKISYSEYLHHDWKAKKVDKRVAEREGYTEDVYTIQSTKASHHTHPDYPDPLTQEEADKALQELGCFTEVKMSPRVKGSIKTSTVVKSEFYPCDPCDPCDERKPREVLKALNNHAEVKGKKSFRDPFKNSATIGKAADGRWKGNLRGYKVFEYESDIEAKEWGMTDEKPRLTICYHKGVLGLALRYYTKETTVENTLKSHNSMYKKE
jgi:hypothetical protein